MPRMLAADHLLVLREVGEGRCGVCFCWANLRTHGAVELFCLGCGAVCTLEIETSPTGQEKVVEKWRAAAEVRT